MSCWKKLGLILWKNWLFRRRHYIMTALEIIFPTLFALALYALWGSAGFGVETSAKYVAHFTEYPMLFSDEIYVQPEDDPYILYYPNTNASLNLLKKVSDIIGREGVDSVSEMEARLPKFNQIANELFWAGVVFEGDLRYRIRIPRQTSWNTAKLEIEDTGAGLPRGNAPYEDNLFVYLQNAIAAAVIENASGKSIDYVLTYQGFPYPPYNKDSLFSVILTMILPLFVTLSYIFTVPITVRRIVREKEVGIKELMKLMGIPSWIQWYGWFVSSFVIMALSAIIIVTMLCIPTKSGFPVLKYSAPELVYIIFLFYISASICFCFFITTLFSKPTVAAGVTVLLWLLSFCVPYYSIFQSYRLVSTSSKVCLALIPNMAMGMALRIIAGFESQKDGIQWRNLFEAVPGDNISMFVILTMMIVDVFLYLFLTWYIGNVYPGVHGVPKPFYFFLMKGYWCARSAGQADVTIKEPKRDKSKFESDPKGLPTSIAIKNLSKSYGWKSSAMAVDNLCLNIYQGQITALLGHNGAGKTTTMSILTGMTPPSKGTAYVNGFDVRSEIDQARKDLGLCPQANMLFDKLTVKEHLQFFGILKINLSNALDIQISTLMQRLNLTSKKNTFAMDLSGGMKRKLNLGIALIGEPKVIMLDEPTSGMDPEARRAIWDLLKAIRPGRCILLSTHFMDEADVLGDRIAIMAAGQLQCCGSPIFLKKEYGAGYHLKMNLVKNSAVNKITDIVRNVIPDSTLEERTEYELSYILPMDESSHFADLFDELEAKSTSLGINSFGLSVTTMEEVFLKVGDPVHKTGSPNTVVVLTPQHNSVIFLKKSGMALKMQQFYGLILKRFYYARRRYILFLIQILLPLVTIVFVIFLNNGLGEYKEEAEPVLLMDLTQYKHCFAFARLPAESNEDKSFLNYFLASFPSSCTVSVHDDPIQYIKDAAIRDFIFYRNKLLFGVEFSMEAEPAIIHILYNEHFHHTLPMAINIVHNALLKFHTRNKGISLRVENAPFRMPKEEADELHSNTIYRLIRSTLMGIFMPIGLSMMVSSLIVFVIHERVTKCKHIQFMTGISGTLYWVSALIWDWSFCIVVCCLSVTLFAFMDHSGIFNGENIAILLLLLILYCWAAICFVYLASNFFRLPAAGFTAVTVLNLGAGLILSIWIFMLEEFKKGTDIKWLFSIMPNYLVSFAIMKIVYIADSNAVCIGKDDSLLESICNQEKPPIGLRHCCADKCGDSCFVKSNYITIAWPGIAVELIALALAGLVYLLLTCIIDNASGSDYLIVRDLTKYFGRFKAVNGLSFGVENGACFGLLGINGAGKTTTFRQLTGDLLIDSGDAIIRGFSITKNKSQYLVNIGYCPQFDALLDHLTGREMLRFFANLYGIPYRHVNNTVKEALNNFDLSAHANKRTSAYSGGNKRKLSAALAFIGRPMVVFLDEPTTGVDPVARRKLWNMIKQSNKDGTAIVLTSHSMEECEVLCSRIGIMVQGQFKCFGGVQYLKNKFSQGYTILAKLKQVDNGVVNQIKFQKYIQEKLPSAVLQDVHQGLVGYVVKDPRTKLGHLFVTMEKAKESFQLEDYSVTQVTLEQVFLMFARIQEV